jgi:hypothetical protein
MESETAEIFRLISTDEYKEWLKKNHNVEIDDKTESYYESVTSKIKVDFENSQFWIALNKNLKEFNDEYQLKNNYQLLMDNNPKLEVKPYSSFLLKSQRKNVFENPNLPDPPNDGWIFPCNWFTNTNDILRTY